MPTSSFKGLCVMSLENRNGLDQVLIRLPFFPTRLRSAKNKEVRRVDDGQRSSLRTLVSEFQRRRLILVLETPCIMLHLVNAGQFDPVTLELDGDAHFSARISPADILVSTPAGNMIK